MKKLMANFYVRQGFTLIELMIVIVILGVLMGTILPRLTGAQARARDTGRISDLNNIAQALEGFYNDNGFYPNTTGGAIACLNATPPANTPARTAGQPMTGDQISVALGAYLKGNAVPKPPSGSQVTGGCTGQYVYRPLQKSGIANNSYMLATDMETFNLANANWTEVSAATDVSGVQSRATQSFTAELTTATNTVFVYIP